MIFETHAHYDDEAFASDQAEMIQGIFASGVGHIVNVGSTIATSDTSVQLAHTYSHIFAAVGVHPEEIGDFTGIRWNEKTEEYEPESALRQSGSIDGLERSENSAETERMEKKLSDPSCMTLDESRADAAMEHLRTLTRDPKVVAIGEIGLDYYWVKDPVERKRQQYWFRRQLALAKETGLPVIIHARDAAADTMQIMTEAAAEGIGGVIHCYSYSREQALQYIRKGYFIGVGGVVTFKNGRKLRETVEAVPIERIVLETDSPYMSPEPLRGRRNDSRNLKYIAARIAEIKNIPYDEVVRITEQNAYELYSKCAMFEQGGKEIKHGNT